MEAFAKQTSPLYLERENKDSQSRDLATTRDTLLPKLLSGELRVPDAEALVEAAV